MGYLGYDPFTIPALGRPKGNETPFVAFLSSDTAGSIGLQILRRRMELKKTRKKLAKELGLSVKTLWGWETQRRQPSAQHQTKIDEFLGFNLKTPNAAGK